MAITTYSELKTAVTNWTHRADLATYADEFIDMVEAKLNRELRVSDMENSTSVAVTTADLSLPAGFLEMREISISGSPDTTLEYLTPYQFEQKQTTETGKPRFYTIQADAIKLFPYGSYTVKMVYYKSVTALDSINTSNFVLSSHPDLYLHGVLAQAFVFVRNTDAAMMHQQMFDSLLAKVNTNSKRKTFSGAPLQIVPA